MSMKTYCFEEVLAHGEIVEWVPADVAGELFEALSPAVELLASAEIQSSVRVKGMTKVIRNGDKAIKKACGEL